MLVKKIDFYKYKKTQCTSKKCVINKRKRSKNRVFKKAAGTKIEKL